MEIVGEVLEFEDRVGHSRVRLKSLLESLNLNKAWRREVGSSRECIKVFAMCIECPTELERRGGPFIAPQKNLAVEVSETRTCPSQGVDMSDQPLWNPAWGPDMSGLGLTHRGNLVRSDISELGVGHVRPTSLKFGYRAGYVRSGT
jgi:hypothetical protein